MSNKSVKIWALALLLSLAAGIFSPVRAAQNGIEPRREELLNRLRVLLWSQPTNAQVSLNLRIQSGAAFDLAGKMGTMALLGDLLFPDPETRNFFTEELGGSLEVTTDYDAINIRMSGRATEFERMLELLRTALVNTPLTDDNVIRLRAARIKMVRELSVAPSFVADRAIAKRLFGDYPYGRPAIGTTDSLARIERADLLLARDRFLRPDNATLVLIGGVQESRALRALRQLLGSWSKGDKSVPSTFRQPDAPDARTLLVDMPNAENAELRLATRALSRADKDSAAAALLVLLVRDRWQASLPELSRTAFFVRHESHLLSGMFVLGASVKTTEAAQALESARGVLRSLSETQTSLADFERARSEALATLNTGTNEPAALSEMWLDAESYKLDSDRDEARAFIKLTPADVQRVAARLFRDAQFATVAIGNAAQLKASLEPTIKVEILGASAEAKPAPATTPAKSP